jgi:AcrR family transcriptional regulator
MPKSRKEQNFDATRAALMAVARKHFARDGYSDAEIAAIAADARVTTGAVYHHFASKKGLFTAVAEDLEAEILRTAASVADDDPWQRLRRGFEKLIDLCAAPAVQRIVFVEAPQVVGPEAWRKIELQYAFGTLRNVLTALRDVGIIKPYPIDLIARTLLALLHETSAELARSKHDPAVRTQISEMVAGVFDVFLASRPV